MTRLDSWLRQATRRLSEDSVEQVRTEIQEHYEEARDAAIADGATADGTDRLAVNALGDARTANTQYRRVLLTCDEARVLRDGNREAVEIGMSPWFAAPLLPIYTPSRGRVFRLVKWVAITGTFLLVYGPETIRWSWLLISCLWPLAWTEWTRASIRRKLPVAAWPKHLYL